MDPKVKNGDIIFIMVLQPAPSLSPETNQKNVKKHLKQSKTPPENITHMV